MNKKIFTLPFLASLFLLNTGFILKPKLRAFSCGDYYHLAKSNQELLEMQEELLIFEILLSKSPHFFANFHDFYFVIFKGKTF